MAQNNTSNDYSANATANRSTLVMQVKASSISPHSVTTPPNTYSPNYTAPSSYYPGVGVDLSYFGNHGTQYGSGQCTNHYIPNSSSMIRSSTSIVTSEYDSYGHAERYQPL